MKEDFRKMAIYFDEKEQVFMLHTPNTTYAIAITDGSYLCHLYYGKKVQSSQIRYLLKEDEPPYVPSKHRRETNAFLDTIPMEYPETGMGDYRESAFCVRSVRGHRASACAYKGYEIKAGKPKLAGMPATFADEDTCSTLYIYCKDSVLGLDLCLMYSVFEDVDVITRSVRVENNGSDPVYLEKVLSACLEIEDRSFEWVSLCGTWAKERHFQQLPIGYGRANVGSFKGESSHQEHPFIALASKGATEDTGEIYAMHFVYSGNFIGQVERNSFDLIRMTMGIHPEGFEWKLNEGEVFTAPEVVMTYSPDGFGKMTRTLHELYRNHLIRSPYLHKARPILINNWEATYFDFDEKKLLEIAKEASELGIELFVLDDGWFGKRNLDDSSLGDWTVNKDKLPGGLGKLAQEIKALGMKFGIWLEPEMISLDSDLFRAHPDWAIQIPGREITQSRAQFVLDLSRQEIVDYVYEQVAGVLRSAEISYVKWDMNRQLTTIGSYMLPADRQGELFHRYVLGVYQLQERLVTEFPDLLLENCSGGGARFDPGMLYYSPQIWCSDDTDAIERLAIQEGTALMYPLSCIGAHVSVCPNHTVGRVTPFETRGHVALAGTFGYELDVTKLSDEDKAKVKEQVADYHRYNELVREGDYYRLLSAQKGDKADAWTVVDKKKDRALIWCVQVLSVPNGKGFFLQTKGLDPDAVYRINDREYRGDVLMNCGIRIPAAGRDFVSRLFYAEKVER